MMANQCFSKLVSYGFLLYFILTWKFQVWKCSTVDLTKSRLKNKTCILFKRDPYLSHIKTWDFSVPECNLCEFWTKYSGVLKKYKLLDSEEKPYKQSSWKLLDVLYIVSNKNCLVWQDVTVHFIVSITTCWLSDVRGKFQGVCTSGLFQFCTANSGNLGMNKLKYWENITLP